jgi:hypothetical protein
MGVPFDDDILRQHVPNSGAVSGVSGRTQLLPGTLTQAL